MLKKSRNILAAGALVAAGAGGGAALALGGAADAATGSYSSTSGEGGGEGAGGAGGGHAGETPLTGTTAAKVEAAALAKYPGATIDRLETDSDGVYEAHVTTKAGDEVIVQVGKDFTVTGTQTGGAKSGKSGHGDHDGDGPGADAETPGA